MLVTIIQETQSVTATKRASKLGGKASLMSLFSKARDNFELAAGILHFIKTHVTRSDIAESNKERKTLKRGCSNIREILSSCVTG